MKAEHRKELHTNLLADRMGKLLQSVKSGPRSTSLVIWIGLGLVLLTVLVWRIYAGRAVDSRSELWTQIDAALHDDERGMQSKLKQLASEHARTLPGRVARFQVARLNLQDGIRKLPGGPFRLEATDKLIKARDEFARLAGECIDDPVLGAEALMSQARAEEALVGAPYQDDSSKSHGDLDRALEAYRVLVKRHPTSAEAKVAEERIKVYEDEAKRRDLEQFYARMRDEFSRKLTPQPGT
jgi:hypothetical protein